MSVLSRSVLHILSVVTMTAVSSELLSLIARAVDVAGSFRDQFQLFFTPIVLAVMLSPLWENF